MADFFLVAEAADLALGKPSLEHFPDTATVAEAIQEFQLHSDGYISVWQCSRGKHSASRGRAIAPQQPGEAALVAVSVSAARKEKFQFQCVCVGVVSRVDILCHLAKDESLQNPELALQTRVSELLPPSPMSVRHVDPKASLLEALALMVEGAHHLVIPIDARVSKNYRRSLPIPCAGKQGQKPASSCKGHCWLTQEDVVRYMFGCMGVFAPLPMMRVDDLGIINPEFLKIDVKASARAALDLMKAAGEQWTCVAVVEEVRMDNSETGFKLVGDLSSFSMWDSDESVAFGLATLSVEDFLSFAHDTLSSSQGLLELVRNCAADKVVDIVAKGMEHLTPSKALHASPCPPSTPGSWEESSSDDEDEGHSGGSSPDGPFQVTFGKPRPPVRLAREWSFTGGRGLSITCRPWSSLAAVMAQALANRVTQVWVTDADDMLIGVITFREIIELLLSELTSLE